MAGSLQSARRRRRRLVGRVVFFLLLIFSVLIFFASQANDSGFENGKNRVDSTLSPVMTYLTMPIRGFETFMNDQRLKSKVHAENQRLRDELARLSDVEARANALGIKLSRLEAMLNVDVSSGVPQTRIAARAVTETNGPFVRSTLINAGAKSGIKKGYAVMTSDGLLGHIVRVGKRSARVLRLEDLNSRIPVISMRSQARAILAGDNTGAPKLSFISESADWEVGDVVVTSGDGGVLPAGLPVGYVIDKPGNDRAVHLYVNDNHMDWVWVYPFVPMTGADVEDISDSDNLEEDGAVEAPATEGEQIDGTQTDQAQTDQAQTDQESEAP